MSLRIIAPRILSRYRVQYNNTTLVPFRINTAPPARRGFSSPPRIENKKLTPEEVEAALEKANESMKAYYTYPTEKVIALKKAKFQKRHFNNQFYLQAGLASSLVCAFLLTPFIGRKIAYDEAFRNKYVPSWYDYTLEKPKNAWSREELQQQVMMLQKKLHERAIAGEFTPEKLDQMRRTMHEKPEEEEYAHFAQLHPGVDDDEELED